MQSPVPGYLERVLTLAKSKEGAPADYIPELARVDPDHTALALATVDGAVYSAGDDEIAFSIQSMSKPLAYGIALTQRGIDTVLEHVGVEPSGEAFNEISLDTETGRPKNPMINAGAITTFGLLDAQTADEVVLDTFSRLAGRRLDYDEPVFRSELATAHRNRGIAHLLRSVGMIDGDPDRVVEGYTRQCAIRVTVRDLAVIAATLANGGRQILTGEQIFDAQTVRQVLSLMLSSGMYDTAGDWLTRVGLPAKSGVAGGIFGVLPGQLGAAVFSPRLDHHGHSVRGVQMMQQLAINLDMHVMSPPRPSRSALGDVTVTEIGGVTSTMVQVRGDLVFASTESLIRAFVNTPPQTKHVVFDLSYTDEVSSVGRTMAYAAGRGLAEDGHVVALIDPSDHFVEFETQVVGGVHVETIEQLAEIARDGRWT